ncbi:V-type ATP synthase subunit C [uncultured archaeon]|nr:V-type ATP synthase subunit C [uncultured archaeon]
MNVPSPLPSLNAFAPADLLSRITGRLKFKPLVYGYANSRVHGLYSRFLTPEQLHALLTAPGPDAMAELLERTAYKEDLVALSLQFKGDDLLELAVSRHFARFCKLLLSFSPAEARPVLSALLGRWDAHNLKVVLLARRQKKPFEQVVPYLVQAGSMDEERLRAIHAAPSGEEVLHLLRASSVGRALTETRNGELRAAERLRKLILSVDSADSLQPLMDEFDRLVYQFAMRSTKGLGDSDSEAVGRMLARSADEKNFSTVLRLRTVEAKTSQVRHYLVPGGSIPASKWLELAQAGPDSPAAQRLAWRLRCTAALQAYVKDRSLSQFEVALARLSTEQSVRAFRRSQLSIGVLVGALMLKEQEMSNIRKIVRGKSLRLPAAEIEKMLVRVHA